MEFHLPILFFIFSIISFRSYADQTFSPVVYWKKVLPNTSMPKAITDSLHDGVTVHTGPKHKPFYVDPDDDYVQESYIQQNYHNAATKTQLRYDPTVAIFFLQENLKPGTKMTFQFPRMTGGAAFLPRHVADSIPFSTAEFSTILRRFSVAPGSDEAAVMKQTIKDCKRNGVVGEEKYCPTSLESMVDFAVSKLGGKNSVTAVSTDADLDDGKKKEFTVKAVKEVTSDELVACHKEGYPYAVFYCHKAKSASAYTVELAADMKVVEAVAVCHKDTSAWNPKHLAFQLLKVKPGVPICHFMSEDAVVWARN